MSDFNQQWSSMSAEEKKSAKDKYGGRKSWKDAKAKSQGYKNRTDRKNSRNNIVQSDSSNPEPGVVYPKGWKKMHKENFRTVNNDVVDMLSHPDDSVRRTNWTDTYDDDGTITWSTGSKRRTPERRQENKTFKQLERDTGLDFERIGRGEKSSDIHIKRYGDNDKYFEKKYKDTEWYPGLVDNLGGNNPGGLHHSAYRQNEDGYQPYSRIEAPKFSSKEGDYKYGDSSQHILSHEIGHALGLRDMANEEEQSKTKNYSVMSYNTNLKLAKGQNRFGESDIEAIKNNYGLN